MSSSMRSLAKSSGFYLFLMGFVICVTILTLPAQNPIQVYSTIGQAVPLVRKSLPNRIQIASLIDLPVQEMPFGRDGWGVATNAASIASTSARPGESGNIVIYSHNFSRLFGRLSRVKIGDRITLTSADGSLHLYTVTQKDIVSPSQIDALVPTNTEILTLYTCSGLFDSKRLVMQALPSI